MTCVVHLEGISSATMSSESPFQRSNLSLNINSAQMLNQNTLWPQPLASSPSPIHTPTGTPSRTPGTPTVNLPNTTTSAPYNFHGSPSQNPYSFENPGAYYHPSYYYHAPPGHSYTPAFNTILPLHDTRSTTLDAPSTNDHPSGSSQATASAKRGQKMCPGR